MAVYHTTVWSPRPQADVFEYLARFSNAAEWDPGVIEAQDTTPGPPRQGSSYRLVVAFLRRRIPLDYRITEINPPLRVVLEAENAMIRSTDVIEVAPAPQGGSAMTYTATLTLKGVMALFAPLLGAGFKRIGDRAAQGLRDTLAA